MAPAVPKKSTGICYSLSLDSLFLCHGWHGSTRASPKVIMRRHLWTHNLPFLVEREYLLFYSFSKNPRIAFHQLGLYDCLFLDQFMWSALRGLLEGVHAALPSHGLTVGPQKKLGVLLFFKGGRGS